MRRVLPAVLLLVGLYLLINWITLTKGRQNEASGIPRPSPRVVESTTVTEGLTILTDTPFEREYGIGQGSQENDLRLLDETLMSARILVKDHYRIPFADNRDFTAFLTGNNSHKVAWIRPGHPAINSDGELTDRWGTPLFFHQDSSVSTTLRSAGKDKVLWSEDDIVHGGGSSEVLEMER